MSKHKILTFKEFLNKFGNDSTSNFDLLRWSKELKIPNFHVCMKDEIKKLKRLKKLPLYIVCNYQLSNQSGNHWICMIREKEKSFYFDSYGIDPLPEAVDFFKCFDYSKFKIQNNDQRFCGQLSLFIIYSLHNGKDFYSTVLDLYSHKK